MERNSSPASILRFLSIALAFAAPAAFAEKADKDKPVNLEADRITVDDAQKVHILEGNVVLIRGTLVIRTDKMVVTQDAEGYQRGVAYGGAGGLARFRQKREGKDEYVEGEAERLEHDARTDITQLFDRAYVKSGLDEVRGRYIEYNGDTENYVVTSGPNGTVATNKSKAGRVHAIIQPKNAPEEGAPSATASPAHKAAPLKSSPEIANPRQE